MELRREHYAISNWSRLRAKLPRQLVRGAAEGIDILRVDSHGHIVRAEGYWDAAAFRQVLAAN